MKTDASIVLTFFGGERCVTTLGDLKAAARSIHSKAVRESETSAQLSTFVEEIEGQIRLIYVKSATPTKEAP